MFNINFFQRKSANDFYLVHALLMAILMFVFIKRGHQIFFSKAMILLVEKIAINFRIPQTYYFPYVGEYM